MGMGTMWRIISLDPFSGIIVSLPPLYECTNNKLALPFCHATLIMSSFGSDVTMITLAWLVYIGSCDHNSLLEVGFSC